MFLLILKKRLHLFLVLLFLCTSFSSNTFCQVNSLAKVPAQTNKKPVFLQENVYIHTDRSFYVAGEVMWYKAYVTDYTSKKPLAFSKVLYVEILNSRNQPVFQSKIKLEEGNGSGSFYIPFSMASGSYVFRAYTNMMKNFAADAFFQKNISIINTGTNPKINSIKKAENNITALFFPEGGTLVNGLSSIVAFKVVDPENNGMNVKGVIVDQEMDTVVSFQSLKFGMGRFSITPQAGKIYSAILHLDNGSSVVQKLPAALNSGVVMHVVSDGEKTFTAQVEAKNISASQQPEGFLIIKNGQEIKRVISSGLQNNKAVFKIEKDSVPSGVSEVIILDKASRPLAQRSIFIKPKEKMTLQAKSDKETYQLRKKVVVGISVADTGRSFSNVDMSAAVYRLDDLTQNNSENISSYLWLSSVIKEPVENAAWYFENKNGEADEAIENLMLTQTSSVQSTANSEKNQPKALAYIPEYSGHFITGQVVNEETNLPAPNIPVYLSVPGRRVQLRVCISDSIGRIHFEMKDFYGKNQIVLQTANKTDSIYRIEIFSAFSEKYTASKLPQLASGALSDKLYEKNIHMEVQNSFHQKDMDQFEKPAIDSLPFYFKPFKTYILSNYTRFTTMEEVLREYVLEVNVRRSGSKYRLAVFNAPGFALRDKQSAETIFDNNPLVLLDGVPVFDMNKVIAYDPLKVEKIDIVAERYHFGTLTADGIVNFTTYKGAMENHKLDPHDIVLDYEGLQENRVFYSPQYTTESQDRSRIPDFRELLFWAPDIKINNGGKGEFSFFTGDVPGKYMVVVQALSADGVPGSYHFTFDVKK